MNGAASIDSSGPADRHPSGGSADSDPRSRILAAARAHFLRFGFARCSMDFIASEVGMSKKTVYQHFRSKDELVEAVLGAKITGFRGGIEVIMAQADIEFAERAHRLTAHIVAQMGEVAPVFLRDLERLMPALYARVESVRREILPGVWGRMLEEGIARGHVRGSPPPSFIAEVVLLSVEGLLRPVVLERLNLTPGTVIQGVLSTIFAGILTPAGRQAYESSASI
jgi:AcrR family transcriptional regulator